MFKPFTTFSAYVACRNRQRDGVNAKLLSQQSCVTYIPSEWSNDEMSLEHSYGEVLPMVVVEQTIIGSSHDN